MKRILIATPALDQKVDCYYVHSLCESIKLGARHNLEINAVFLANESILPMARNELFYLAVTQNYDAMVFIDDDEKWDAEHLIEILQMEQDVITMPVVNKGDRKIEFNVVADATQPAAENGLVPCAKTGTGFLKISRCVFMDLWNSSMPIQFRNKELRLICEYGAVNGDFVGEDIMLSTKIRELGYKIWIYPDHTVEHIGNKIYTGTWTPPRPA
jgi:hypothetical protein